MFLHNKTETLAGILGLDLNTYEFLRVFPAANRMSSGKQNVFNFLEIEQDNRTEKDLDAEDKFRDCIIGDQTTLGRDSLFGILNVCCTPMGSRMLRDWLNQPLTDLRILKQRHSAVKLFFDFPILRSNIRALLTKCCDFGATGNITFMQTNN